MWLQAIKNVISHNVKIDKEFLILIVWLFCIVSIVIFATSPLIAIIGTMITLFIVTFMLDIIDEHDRLVNNKNKMDDKTI